MIKQEAAVIPSLIRAMSLTQVLVYDLKQENQSCEFSTRSDINQPLQSKKIARSLKFQI